MRKKYLLLLIALLVSLAANAQQGGSGDLTTTKEINRMPRAEEISTKAIYPEWCSLKKYTVQVGAQGLLSTCVAWSAATARAICYAFERGINNKDSLRKYAFSPEYLYYCIKHKNDSNCMRGASIDKALDTLIKSGIVFRDPMIDACPKSINAPILKTASLYRIKDKRSLSTANNINNGTIRLIKDALVKSHPVIISLLCFPSFKNVGKDGLWTPGPDLPRDTSYHSMCVIGYNDTIAGGAIEVMNSWGEHWGNGGYFWLTYEQLKKYGRYAVEMIDQNTSPSIITGKMDFLLPDNSKMNVRLVSNPDFADFPYTARYLITDTFSSDLRFKIKLTVNEHGYTYILEKNENGRVQAVYTPGHEGEANDVKKGLVLPVKGNYTVGENRKETLLVLFTRWKINLPDLVDYINGDNGTLYEGLSAQAGNENLPINQANFDDQSIQFKILTRKVPVIICYTVELNTTI